LAIASLIAFQLGTTATFGVVFAAVMLCAVELFDSLRRAGHQPVTLVGVVAVAGLLIGTFAGANTFEGERVVPLVLALSIVSLLAWHLVGASRAPVTTSVAVTLLGIVWVGVLGSFAVNLLNLPNRAGIAILAVAAIGTMSHDIAGFVVGRRFGRTPLAPSVSPGKTIEGLVGGMFAAFFVTGIVGSQISPIAEAGLAEWKLGIVIALVAPFGDLVESLVKRDLRLKDTGSILPGHGGVFDRFDALLVVIPVVYYLTFAFNIV
jgi:phosphatidate cytidylyltransferase